MADAATIRSRPTRSVTPLGLSVPRVEPGVCARCHGPALQGAAECWCCRRVGVVLGEGPGEGARVIPVALCHPGDPLHSALRRYKDAPALSARRHYSGLLGRLLERYMAVHLDCLLEAVGPWDSLAEVPSSGRGSSVCVSPCPLRAIVAAVPALARCRRVEVVRGEGSAAHLRPARDAFAVSGPASGRRVILLEDAWVTGARARSAAAALASAGAQVAAVVAMGRVVDPCASPSVATWWERQRTEAPRRAGSCCSAGCLQGAHRPGL